MIDAAGVTTLWSGRGGWDRVASDAGDGEDLTILLAATRTGRWTQVDGNAPVGHVADHVVNPPLRGIALWSTGVLLAASDTLALLDASGSPLDAVTWPGTATTLVGAGPGTAFVHDPPSGRVTQLLAGPAGTIRVGATLRLGDAVTIGWWQARDAVLALAADRILWWRPPRLPPPAPVQAQEPTTITFIGPL